MFFSHSRSHALYTSVSSGKAVLANMNHVPTRIEQTISLLHSDKATTTTTTKSPTYFVVCCEKTIFLKKENNFFDEMTQMIWLLFVASIQVANGVDSGDNVQRLDAAIEHLTVATLAVGERARSFTVTLIHSFVRNGQVNCPLHIVTEDVAYFAPHMASLQESGTVRSGDARAWHSCSSTPLCRRCNKKKNILARARIKFVAVTNDADDPIVESDDPVERREMKKKLAARPGGGVNIHMKVKLLKTQLLQLVPREFDFVLYVDRWLKQQTIKICYVGGLSGRTLNATRCLRCSIFSDIVIGKALRPFLYHALSTMINVDQPPRYVCFCRVSFFLYEVCKNNERK